MTKKVFIYVRRSSDISIEKQVEEIQKLCNEKGFIVEGIYKDNQSTFLQGNGKEYIKMIDEIEKRNNCENKIDIIYIYKILKGAGNNEELNLNKNIQILSIK